MNCPGLFCVGAGVGPAGMAGVGPAGMVLCWGWRGDCLKRFGLDCTVLYKWVYSKFTKDQYVVKCSWINKKVCTILGEMTDADKMMHPQRFLTVLTDIWIRLIRKSFCKQDNWRTRKRNVDQTWQTWTKPQRWPSRINWFGIWIADHCFKTSPLRNTGFLDINFVSISHSINGRFDWRNDWRRLDNASTTFRDRSDRHPDPG